MSRLWLKLTGKNTKDGKIYVCTNQECSYRRRKDLKYPITVAHNAIKNGHHRRKNGRSFKCKFCSITEKIPDKKNENKND